MGKMKNYGATKRTSVSSKPRKTSVRSTSVRRSTPRKANAKRINRTQSRRARNVRTKAKRPVPKKTRTKTTKTTRPKTSKRANVKKANVRKAAPKKANAKKTNKVKARRAKNAKPKAKQSAPTKTRTKTPKKTRTRKTKSSNVNKTGVRKSAPKKANAKKTSKVKTRRAKNVKPKAKKTAPTKTRAKTSNKARVRKTKKVYKDNRLRDQEVRKWYEYTNKHGLKARGILHEKDRFTLECVVNSAVGVGRQGCENVLPSAKKAGMSNVDRAHVFGHIIGAETERGVLYAPSKFNKTIQKSFFEGPIKALSQHMKEKGYQTILSAEVKADDRNRLKSISYRILIAPQGANPWDSKARVTRLDLGSFNINWTSNNGADAKITREEGDKNALSKLEKLLPDSYNIGGKGSRKNER